MASAYTRLADVSMNGGRCLPEESLSAGALAGAVVAQPAQFDHRAHVGEAVAAAGIAQRIGQLVVVEVQRL